MLTKMLITIVLSAIAIGAFLFLIRHLIVSTITSLTNATNSIRRRWSKEKPKASAVVEAAFNDLETVMNQLAQRDIPEGRTSRLRHGYKTLSEIITKLRQNPDLAKTETVNDDFAASARRIRMDAQALLDDQNHKEADDMLIGLDVLNEQLKNRTRHTLKS